MGHCYHHALSSVKKWGGTAGDYLPLHQWFDESKAITADFRHRALRHHAEGIFMLERFFGPTITISTGRVVPVRLIGEQHVREDRSAWFGSAAAISFALSASFTKATTILFT
ncbi:MAG: DUF6915 family protein, partial [Beijerinckiaceae bacterium]